MELHDVLYSKKDGMARIIINRPERHNSFSRETCEELTHCFLDADEDMEIGVIVLSGAGGKAFSAGGYLGDVKDLQPIPAGRSFFHSFLRLSTTMRRVSKPVIAAIRGYCVGGGNELNLFCDLAIATTDSVFGQTGPRVGATPILGTTQLLPLLIGDRKAREVLYLCRTYSAEEALRLGWVNKVVPPEELEAEVDRWCEEILDKSPQSLRLAKASFNALGDLLYSSFTHGLELLTLIAGSPQMVEGATAFLEKRPPDFRRFRRDSGIGDQ